MNLLYFSPVPWNWPKQRPQFLAEGFAGIGHKVLYFSRNAPGNGHNRTYAVSPALYVQDRAVLPFALRFPLIDRINSAYLRHTVAWEKFDVVFLTEPRQVQLLPLSDTFHGKIIYDCMDKSPDFFPGKIRTRQIELEKQLCQKADCIVVSSQFLRKHLIDTYAVPHTKIRLIRNGINDRFLSDPASSPGELVYIGSVDSWFDWNCLSAYAQKHPERTITLIGPVRCKPEHIPANILLKGKIPHEQVCRYVRGASLLLIPFQVNSLIKAVDPVKLYEYLSLGKHVLSAYWEELDHFLPNEYIHFYHSDTEFDEIAERILVNPSSKKSTPDCKLLDMNCWAARIKEYQTILEEISCPPI